MSSEEVLYHETYNAENFRDALQRAENIRHNHDAMKTWDVKRMWSGRATPEEDTRMISTHKSLSYIAAYRALIKVEKLEIAAPESADVYYANHSELHDNRVPALIAARAAKANATAAQFQNVKQAIARAGNTAVTEYAYEQMDADIQKPSFRELA